MPYLNEVGEAYDPTYGTITLNTATAKAKGLKAGYVVTVESENGKVTGKLFVTELLVPDVVGVAGALGRLVKSLGSKAAGYLHYNKLTSTKLMDCDPVAVGITNRLTPRLRDLFTPRY